MAEDVASWVSAEVLKSDSFGSIERGEYAGQPAILRRAKGGSLPGSGFAARLLMRREARALAILHEVRGIVPVLDQPSRCELIRGWAEGKPLHLATELPEDFFDQLRFLVIVCHELGVCHNDLHKEPNVLVAPDGYPWLVDFQLASVHRLGSSGLDRRAAEDMRHIAKHERRYKNQGSGGRERGKDRGLVARLWMATGTRVYNFITRRVFKRTDGEGRRPRGGPWPKWTPALGPR
jgi:RIO-like serine/threonine protein kinase